MSKTATYFIIDRNPSMANSVTSTTMISKFAVATDFVRKSIQGTINNNLKGDLVDVIFVGGPITCNPSYQDGSTEYEFINDMNLFLQVDASEELPSNPNLLQVPSARLWSGVGSAVVSSEERGDLIEALILALATINTETRSKSNNSLLSYQRTIYIVTDGQSSMESYEDENFKMHVENGLKALDIKLVLIYFDRTDIEEQGVSEESRAGLDRWRDLQTHGSSKSFEMDGQEALEAIQLPKVRKIRQMAMYSGPLKLGSKDGIMHIQVITKTGTKPFLSSEKRSERDGEVTVLHDYIYYREDEDQPIEVCTLDPSTFLKGYRFGKEYIPFSNADLVDSDLGSIKTFEILAITSIDNIGREQFMGHVSAVTGDGNFTSLMIAMKTLKVGAVVKYIAKNGSSLKLMWLTPNAKNYGFFVQIPFMDDIREFEFPNTDMLTLEESKDASRKGSKKDVVLAIDDLIECMDLDQTEGLYWPKNVPNVLHQRKYTTLLERASDPLVPVRNYTEDEIWNLSMNVDSLKAAKNLNSLFDIKQVVKQESTRQKRKSK